MSAEVQPGTRRRAIRALVTGPAILASLILIASPALAAPGDLDPNFGDGGLVLTPFAGPASAFGVVRQPVGKVVALGCANDDFALARYASDGSLDQAFGTGGRVTTPFSVDFDCGFDIARQPDGKLVAAGCADGDFALARYKPNGALDQTFGDAGRVITDFGGLDCAFALLIQPDGKLVAAGEADLVGGGGDFALARYNTDGSPDETFGEAGIVTTDFGGEDDIQDIGYLDGRLIGAGHTEVAGDQDFALARYDTDGALDPTFGIGGKVTTDFGSQLERAFALVIRKSGKLVVGGYAFTAAGGVDFALARYESDGNLDETFGQFGLVTTDLSGVGGSDTIRALKGMRGRMVAVGESVTNLVEFRFAVVAYKGDGSLVEGFGQGGKVITDFGQNSVASDVILHESDGLVTAGSAGEPGDFALARYLLS